MRMTVAEKDVIFKKQAHKLLEAMKKVVSESPGVGYLKSRPINFGEFDAGSTTRSPKYSLEYRGHHRAETAARSGAPEHIHIVEESKGQSSFGALANHMGMPDPTANSENKTIKSRQFDNSRCQYQP